MKKNKYNFKEMINELNTAKKQLSEDYFFGDEEGPMGGGMHGEEDPRMMRHHGGEEMAKGDSEEEKALHAQEVLQHEPIITKIREIAIEGLKKYADHPTSTLYEYFKSVLLDSDKVLEGGGKK